MIEKLNISHIDQVVAIHMVCFPESQSTKFGEKFLDGYYKGVSNAKNNVSYVDIEEEKVAGFIIGGVNKQALSRQIIFHSKFTFMISGLVNIIKTPTKSLKKYWSYLKNYILPNKETFYSNNTAVLDSLAILSEYRGRGIAEKLVKEFLANLKSQKISACRLGVESTNAAARNFYEKMNFIQLNSEGTIYIHYFDDIYKNKYKHR